MYHNFVLCYIGPCNFMDSFSPWSEENLFSYCVIVSIFCIYKEHSYLTGHYVISIICLLISFNLKGKEEHLIDHVSLFHQNLMYFHLVILQMKTKPALGYFYHLNITCFWNVQRPIHRLWLPLQQTFIKFCLMLTYF